MSIKIVKTFTDIESAMIYNLYNRVFFDNNGNMRIISDTNYPILTFQNPMTNVAVDTKIYEFLIQNVDNVTVTTNTFGLINNNPADDNPCLSANGKWILIRNQQFDKSTEYVPIYNIAYYTGDDQKCSCTNEKIGLGVSIGIAIIVTIIAAFLIKRR
jgi:hypothetical protein